jgi:pyruvate formate lyase activating enzyme
MLPIHAVTPFTLLDFPGLPAAVVWCSGCNMRCAYCHNPDIVRGKAGQKTPPEVLAFLATRRGLLEGVVLSGGEATLWPGLPGFIAQVRALGFAVKLDTNGTRPETLRGLLPALDYVALDYKAPPGEVPGHHGSQRLRGFPQVSGHSVRRERAL